MNAPCFYCGADNIAGSRFCNACGASLGASAAAGGDTSAAGREGTAERRQLTILFCDLVGYTKLSTELDPEDLRNLIARYQTLVATEIRRYDGSVARFVGDGIMAYFGYPRAHEDDAERAVLAALDVVDSVRGVPALPGQEHAGNLSVRVGIATGEVVVGDLVSEGVSERWAVVGETPNLASRLQAIADSNSVVISASTQRLAAGAFDYDDLGLHRLKGIPEPVRIWRVAGKRVTASRFDAVRGRKLTPMVGRAPELARIDACWAAAAEGRGQVVVVRGEGGIGKSRITQLLWDRLKHESHRHRLRFQCSPYHVNSALHPVIVQIEQSARFGSADTAHEKCAKLEALFDFPPQERAASIALIASLLSIPYDDLYPKLALEPGRQRERTLAVMVARILRLADELPLLCIVEDAHWIDPSTLELLATLVKSVADHPVFLLVTCRPEFVAPWRTGGRVTELDLERLDEREVEEIVAGVTDGKRLPAGVMSQIVAKADGVPLFAEELTKTVLDSGSLTESFEHYELRGTLRHLAIPTTLQDSLMARLDRLSTEKLVAHVAAVIGRSFSYELLAKVADLPAAELTQALDRLQGAELIQEIPQASGLKTFEFRHALIQDAAYQSQLKTGRRANHERIARTIEQDFPATAATQPEVVAHHYGEAECIEPALRHWQAAGLRAIERSANVEALRHFDEALRLIPHVESLEQRTKQELKVQLARGIMLTAVEGYASPSVESAYVRALALCEQAGDDQQRFGALYGLWAFSMVGGRLPAAIDRGQQLLAQAEATQDATSLMLAHRTLGTTYLLIGDQLAARQHSTFGFGLYDPKKHGALAFRIGHDPGVAMGVYRGWTLWLLGRADEGLAASRAALKLAQDLKHPVSIAFALCYLGIVEVHRGEYDAARAHAEEAAALSAEHRLALWAALSQIIHGWALTGLGDDDDGIDELRRGVAAWRGTGAGAGVSFYHAAQAGALLRSARHEEALQVIDDGLAAAQRNGEYFYHAELLRLRSEAIAAASPEAASECEALLHESLDVARRQQTRALELRTAITLARWLVARGRRAEALDIIVPIHGAFTEGFDTVDLSIARELIGQLRTPLQ